ncbi:MAG: hypothetical protein JEZ07_03085 [Phycisphaerae bacterium]|nr:hypothetical protein [Phycisphaerae bacterium]
MSDKAEKQIWKVRTVKNYPDAHNHLMIGKVIEINKIYLRLECKTYHFRKNINSLKDIKTGPCEYRILPWSRIELINELSDNFDYKDAKLTITNDLTVTIDDGKNSCIIASTYDNNY